MQSNRPFEETSAYSADSLVMFAEQEQWGVGASHFPRT